MQQPKTARRLWYWLLIVPFIVMLWAPSFNSIEPSLGGIPFFYWYQFLWIALTAVVVGIVYAFAHGGDRK
jgi:uncharacterized membrane protein